MVVKIRYLRPWDIFGQKSTSRAREPVGNYPTEPTLEAFEILPADWPERYSLSQSVGRSCKMTLSPSYTNSFFSSMEVHAVAEHRNYLKRSRQISHYHNKSPNILTRQSAESKLYVIPQPLFSRSNLEQITWK